MGAPISIRLRAASPGLLALPWLDPLGTWPEDAADFRDLNVGPSRHLVRFVEADYVLYALKELPTRTADKEYRVLRDLEVRELPAVRPGGGGGRAPPPTWIRFRKGGRRSRRARGRCRRCR